MAETLFGMSPTDIQAQRQAAAQQQALQYAKMGPAEAVNYGGYMAGNQLGNALMGMMGTKDPEIERATLANKLAQETDFNDLASVKALVGKLNQAGATREAMSLLPRIDALTKIQEDRTARREDKEAAAEARKAEIEMRGQQRLAEIQAQTTAALERAREANASREQIAQIMAQARTDAARIAAETRLSIAELSKSLKQEKPEKVDDKLGMMIANVEQQKPLIDEADALLTRINAPENKGTFGLVGRGVGAVQAVVGNRTDAVKLQSDAKAYMNKARNAYLLLAKGTQTEGDANRAWEEFAGTLDWTSNEGVADSVSRIKKQLETQKAAAEAYISARSRSGVPPTPTTPSTTSNDGWGIRKK